MTARLPNILVHMALLAFSRAAPQALAATEPQLSAQQLREDVAYIRDTIESRHPGLRHSADPEAVSRALDAIAEGARAGLGRDEAWRRLATLNALFADGHLLVGFPDWRAESSAYLAAGGALFPFEVDIDAQGRPSIRAALGGGADGLAGARILAIDGVPGERAVAELGKRVHGDTPLFRTKLLADRWWLYHWKTYGAAAGYRLELARDGRHWSVEVPASTSQPAVLQGAADFERQFGFEIRPDRTALLRLGSFDHAFKERLLALTRAAFERMREEGVATLVIDISENGGGDDDLWLDGVMPYIATRPYRTGSTYTKRVMETDPARGEVAGQVVGGEIATWRQPRMDNPWLFRGKVVVLVGPSTYSSAVLFANVMQDFGFATLAGSGNAARRTQSGGVRRYMLPHGGLALWVPRFVLDAPSGAPRDALLAPAPQR